MHTFKKFFLLAVCFCFCAGGYAQESADFDATKQQLQQDKEILMRAAELVSGAAGALLGGRILKHYLYRGKSLSEMVSALPVPYSLGSKSARQLSKEQSLLEREAADLEKIYRMIRSKESSALRGDAAALHQADVLKQILRKKYFAFDKRLTYYRQSYEAWARKKSAAHMAVPSRAPVSAGKISWRHSVKKISSKTPLILLFAAWAASSDEPVSVSRQAERLAENPALVFSLSEAEENQIRRSQTLTEIYVYIAQSLHELIALPEADLEEYVRQTQAVRTLEKYLQEEQGKQQLRRTLSR